MMEIVGAGVGGERRTVHDEDHARATLGKLNEDRLAGPPRTLCDVEIEVGERRFPSHRFVLAATIPYFASMFNSEMLETRQAVIKIQDIAPQAFEKLLEFAYTSTLELNDGNVQALLYAASILQKEFLRWYNVRRAQSILGLGCTCPCHFHRSSTWAVRRKMEELPPVPFSSLRPLSSHSVQMDRVCRACEEFLTQYLTLGNCLAIRAFAQLHNCTQLLASVDRFSAHNFQKLRAQPEFGEMNLHHLMDLIVSDDLHVPSETHVFEAVMAWVKVDEDSRKEHLAALLSKVRLSQLPKAYLFEEVKKHPLVAGDVECRSLILEAMEELYRADQWSLGPLLSPPPAHFPAATAQIYSFSSAQQPSPKMERPPTSLLSGSQITLTSLSRPRKSAAGVVFCVGGRGTTGDPFRTVEAYDWRRDAWFPVTEMGVKRRHVGVVSAEGRLYAIGGHDGTEHLGSAEVFDPVGNHWRPVSSMSTKRRGIAVGCLEGAIYAVGGLDDTTCFQIVERYDIEADRCVTQSIQWSCVAEMNVQRGGVGVAALGKYLFAVGGNDGTSSLDSCERYDPHLDKWTLVGGMSHRRAGAGVSVLNGSLYAIGGFDDNSPLSSCERYDPIRNEWSMLPQMSCPRGGVGVAAMGGRLYAVGGHDGVKYLDSVEALDPLTGKWERVAGISHCRAGAGVSWCACSPDGLLSPLPAVLTAAGGVACCV